MFFFHYTTRLKCLLRVRVTLFWTLLFPLLLATLFYIAFGSILQKAETFSPIAAAVVDNAAYKSNAEFRDVLKLVSTGNNRMLDLSVLSLKEAEKRLADGKISGIMTVADTISLKVRNTGINESILKAFVDGYLQDVEMVHAILASNPQAFQQGLMQSLTGSNSYTKEITLSGSAPDTLLNYFYALIAMSCLYGSFWGMRNTTDIQADLSALGARRCVAPTHKLTSVVSDGLAALTIQFGAILITLCYLVFVLGVDFGSRWGYVVLTCFVGSLAGVSFGTFIGSAIKKNERLKEAILVGTTMFFSFLSGLMIADIKLIISQYIPILGYLNPVALLTDAFYSLYVYDSLSRFSLNIGILCALSVLFAFLSYLFVRRKRYASL